jgi:uncharacterized delta-60 repeat protein
MKLKFILMAIIAFANLTFAQILTKDASFATNGVYTSTIPYFTGFTQSADGSIYFTYSPTLTTTVLSKLTSNGTLDTSFGNNGELVLNNLSYQTSLTIQSDNKIVLVCTHYNGSMGYSDVIRVLPNGQLDSNFGSGGIATITDLYYYDDLSGPGILLQNNKLIIYGRGTQNQYEYFIHRLNSNGSIDSSFGTNGKITTSYFKFPFIDNLSNIVTFSHLAIKKYNPNGQPLTSYGNNGVQTINFPISPRGAILDSSNRIVYLEINNETVKRTNPDGTLDSTFNYDNLPNGMNRLVNNLYEKDGLYYICGFGELSSGYSYFISRLTQNGAIDPAFGSFVETDPAFNPGSLERMFVNDNSFIVEDGYRIVKYLKNNTTLSTTENSNNTEIQFENPVKDHLVFTTKEKIKSIEIYSIAGMLVKTLENNSSDVTTLLKGNYIAKVNFKNGKTKTVKIVKK